MTDRLITHDEARKENNLMMENHITLTKEKYQFIAKEMVKRRTTHYKKIDDYITQQEKKDELLEMYKESYELLKEVIVKTGSTRKEWARLKELEKQIECYQLQEKLLKVGKEE